MTIIIQVRKPVVVSSMNCTYCSLTGMMPGCTQQYEVGYYVATNITEQRESMVYWVAMLSCNLSKVLNCSTTMAYVRLHCMELLRSSLYAMLQVARAINYCFFCSEHTFKE